MHVLYFPRHPPVAEGFNCPGMWESGPASSLERRDILTELKVHKLVDTLKTRPRKSLLVLDRWDWKDSSDFNPMVGDYACFEELRGFVAMIRGGYPSFAIPVTEDRKGYGLSIDT